MDLVARNQVLEELARNMNEDLGFDSLHKRYTGLQIYGALYIRDTRCIVTTISRRPNTLYSVSMIISPRLNRLCKDKPVSWTTSSPEFKETERKFLQTYTISPIA